MLLKVLPDITFLNFLPLPVLIGIIAVSSVILFYSYIKFSVPTHKRNHFILAGLRILLLNIILFLMLDPFWNRPSNSDWVGVLIDTSSSMAIKEPGAKYTRLDTVKQFLNGNREWESLQKNTIKKIMRMDSNVSEVKNIKDLESTGPSSRIVDAVFEMDSRYHEDPNLLGWVLISDGAATDSIKDSKVGFESLNFPWITVGVGLDEKVPNIILDAPEIKEPLFVGEVLPVKLKWTSTFAKDETTDLIVRLNEKTIIEKQISLKGGSYQFEITPDRAGDYILEVSLAALEGEGSRVDNEARVFFRATPRKIKVFYSESYYKDKNFFQIALEEDADFEVTFAASVVGFARKWGVPFIKDPSFGFPRSKEDLLKYDVVVLSDVKRNLLSAEQVDWIRELVEIQGGALVMVGGVDSFGDGGYVGTPIEKMLPVEISEEYKDNTYLKARGTNDHPFRPIVSKDAKEHPIFQLLPEKDKNQSLWESIPQLGGYNYVGRLKPGADILLEHPLDASSFGPRVILAAQSFGRGKVLAFTSDITPNWGQWFQDWRSEDGWIYAKFWRHALKWLTENRVRTKASPLELEHEPHLVEENSAVIFKSKLPIEEPSLAVLDLQIFQGNELIQSESFKDQQVDRVAWKVDNLPPGNYVLRAEMKGRNIVSIVAEHPFVVHPSRIEARYLSANPELLKELAETTQGVYEPLSEFKGFEKALNKIRKLHLRRSSAPFWNQWWMYLLIVGILCLDWFIRKKKGLE